MSAVPLEFLAVRAAVTALAVAVVLYAARRSGRRVSGAMAGLPVTTLPSLLWLVATQGRDFAAQAAAGAVLASGAYALLAGLYVRGTRHCTPLAALALAAAPAAAVAAGITALSASPVLVLLASMSLCVLAMAAIGHVSAFVAPARARPVLAWAVPFLAGGMSAAVSAAATVLPAAVCGSLASLPVIAATGAFVQHHAGGAPAVAAFARGYVRGSLVKAPICFVFAVLLVRMAALPALLLALAGGVACSTLLRAAVADGSITEAGSEIAVANHAAGAAYVEPKGS